MPPSIFQQRLIDLAGRFVPDGFAVWDPVLRTWEARVMANPDETNCCAELEGAVMDLINHGCKRIAMISVSPDGKREIL